MIITINDFDGIISLVNSETYNSFVSEDWEIEQLKNHFIDEMNSDSIIVWQTNNFGGDNWKVELKTIESDKIAHSEFTKSIEVTNGKLYLADYTDLTMAAQFNDFSIPIKGHEKQVFEIENGKYEVKIKRLFDPDEELEEGKNAFEIIFLKTTQTKNLKVDQIFWWTF